MNLISENSDTGGIGKFHRCHWWWVMKLFTQPLVLCLLLNDPPLLKQYRIHLYIPLYVNIIQFKPTKNLVTMKLHRKFYKANISFVERLLQWEFGYLWSQRWKFCHRWLRHKCHRVTAVNTDFNQHFFFWSSLLQTQNLWTKCPSTFANAHPNFYTINMKNTFFQHAA